MCRRVCVVFPCAAACSWVLVQCWCARHFHAVTLGRCTEHSITFDMPAYTPWIIHNPSIQAASTVAASMLSAARHRLRIAKLRAAKIQRLWARARANKEPKILAVIRAAQAQAKRAAASAQQTMASATAEHAPKATQPATGGSSASADEGGGDGDASTDPTTAELVRTNSTPLLQSELVPGAPVPPTSSANASLERVVARVDVRLVPQVAVLNAGGSGLRSLTLPAETGVYVPW